MTRALLIHAALVSPFSPHNRRRDKIGLDVVALGLGSPDLHYGAEVTSLPRRSHRSRGSGAAPAAMQDAA